MMVWNPSEEVAVARDAAKALGDAPICVVLWVTAGGQQLGMASYGKTRELCKYAGRIGDKCYEAAMNFGEVNND